MPMREETDNEFINHSLVLHGAMRAKCSRGLVKSKRANGCNEQIHTVFNNKRLVMCCAEFFTCGPVAYDFCVCYDCEVKLIVNDLSEKDVRTSSRPRRNRK